MYSHSYRNEAVTPFEKCRQLLLDLAIEQVRSNRNIDKIVMLKKTIATFPIKTISAAFDDVVDNHGWLSLDPKEIK